MDAAGRSILEMPIAANYGNYIQQKKGNEAPNRYFEEQKTLNNNHMRTIDFRGKRTDNGEWVIGFVRRQYDEDGEEYIFITTLEGDEYEVNPATIGQFTDCVDKNGNCIYEGDILHYEGKRSDNMGKHYRRAVVYHKGAFRFRLEDGKPGAYLGENSWNWDIVGNIHDNEL